MTVERPTHADLYGTIRCKCLICYAFLGPDEKQPRGYAPHWSVCTTCLSSAGEIANATALALAAIAAELEPTDDDD